MRNAPPLPLRTVLLLLLPAGILMLVLFIVPLVWIVLSSLGIGQPSGAWDFSLWLNVLTDPVKRQGLLISLYYSAAPVLLALPLSIGMAVLLQQQFGGRSLFLTIFRLPIGTPAAVVAFAVLLLLDQGGWLSRLLGIDPPRLVRDAWGLGVILTLAAKELPFMVLIISAAMAGIAPELLSAARALGARPLQMLWHVQMPLAWPGISAAALLSFVKLTGAYAVPQIIGPVYPSPLSVLMVDAFQQGRWSEVCAIGMVLSLLSVIVLLSYQTLVQGLSSMRKEVGLW